MAHEHDWEPVGDPAFYQVDGYSQLFMKHYFICHCGKYRLEEFSYEEEK